MLTVHEGARRCLSASEELVLVTNVSGTTLTITRSFNGTSAAAHATGAVVRHVISAQDLTDAVTHYGTALTAGAHGVTGALATFLGTPSSTNLAAVMTDETGTGPLVFSQSPTINNATLTGTSLNFTVNAQTGTTYTSVLADATKVVTLSNASAITVTLPSAVYAVGQTISFVQLGAGQVTFQGDGTSTLLYTPGVKTRTQNSTVSALVVATNTFLLVGDLTA